jgi:hypothetical protein
MGEECTHHGERDVVNNMKQPQYVKRDNVIQGQHANEPMINTQPSSTYESVALLKINKLGDNAERTSGVTNMRRAFLS